MFELVTARVSHSGEHARRGARAPRFLSKNGALRNKSAPPDDGTEESVSKRQRAAEIGGKAEGKRKKQQKSAEKQKKNGRKTTGTIPQNSGFGGGRKGH